MRYITVKQLYERLNDRHPGLIGINAVYDLEDEIVEVFGIEEIIHIPVRKLSLGQSSESISIRIIFSHKYII